MFGLNNPANVMLKNYHRIHAKLWANCHNGNDIVEYIERNIDNLCISVGNITFEIMREIFNFLKNEKLLIVAKKLQ